MFGWINDCTEKLVISKFGVETWHAVKEKAGCTVKDGGFIRHERYSDESTVALVVAASEVLNISVDDVLEAFGVYFMEFTRAEGFEKLLNCQGSTLRTWLSNINALHDHLESAFPRGMIKPVFWCEDDEDVEGSIILHYFSKRGNLLVPIVIGLVKEVARFHFDVAINMVLLQKQGIEGAAFTSFRISAVDESEQWKITVREEWASGVPTFTKTDIPSGARCPFSGAITEDIAYGNEVAQTEIERNSDECQVSISGDKMKEIFPFHVCVDKDFVILQIGKALPNLLKVDMRDLVGKKISEVMEIIKPVHGIWEWHALRKLEDQTFFLQSCINKVALKGNMIKLSQDPYRVVFFLSPDVQNVAELTKTGLTLSDLPLHSFQRDTVFLGEHIVAEVKAAFKLDKLSKNLESEKNVSNNLLYSMLPRMVADDLRAGKVVEPELYPDVTMFFSDIVGFTTICTGIAPMDIVNLLNRLYCVMDFLAEKFHIYKVETIGDAYICACGLPIANDNNAELIANFAIAVLHCCKLVLSPLDGQPIQLRIGINSGECSAGVIGNAAPRFCVFGDMVNTTSRHESTGLPGKIHCSSITYGKIAHFSNTDKKQFNFIPRGLIDMKGKGQMFTYWIDGATDDNPSTNLVALGCIYDEVEAMLATKTFKIRRYYNSHGRRVSSNHDNISVISALTEDSTDNDSDPSDP